MELSRANRSDSPAIPYMFWLLSQFKPLFLFLQETKASVNDVHRLLCSTNPTFLWC